ncbi:MAG: S-layer homology domain-containing protein [Clostridiales bacterium]|nr:S-layer homology domain-containing protein [Clostridiales bacterium]
MKKRIYSFILVLCLLLTSLPVYADVSTEMIEEDITTDGSYESNEWFSRFDNLIKAGVDKHANGVTFYYVLKSLDDGSLNSNVGTALSSDPIRAGRLAAYGLTQTKIKTIMEYYIGTFPASMDAVENDLNGPSGNLYAAIYHDNNVKYSDYMVRFNQYLNELFRQLPYQLQEPIGRWDKKGQGEIILYQSLLNIVIRTNLGIERYLDDNLQSRDLGLLSITNDMIADDLKRYASNGSLLSSTEEAEIDAYAQVFVDLGNVILDACQYNLEYNDQLENTFELGKIIEVIIEDRRYSEDDPVDPEPVTISVNPNGETIFTRPEAGSLDRDSMDFNAFLTGIRAPVEWSVDKPEVVSIDRNGLVTITPEFLERPTDTLVSVTVKAKIQGRPEFDEVILFVSSPEALGGVEFLAPYISGYKDKTFKEFNNITRAEAATMFARILKLDIKEYKLDENGDQVLENNIPVPVYYEKADFAKPSFSDVDQNNWAYLYIETANDNDLFEGLTLDQFNPNQAMTRAEIAVMISNAWEALGIKDDPSAKHFIKDVTFKHWAFDAINRVYNNGIVDGFEDNTFRPESPITRGHIVSMMNTILKRDEYKLPDATFSDIPTDHKSYGTIEAATRHQIILQE